MNKQRQFVLFLAVIFENGFEKQLKDTTNSQTRI